MLSQQGPAESQGPLLQAAALTLHRAEGQGDELRPWDIPAISPELRSVGKGAVGTGKLVFMQIGQGKPVEMPFPQDRPFCKCEN